MSVDNVNGYMTLGYLNGLHNEIACFDVKKRDDCDGKILVGSPVAELYVEISDVRLPIRTQPSETLFIIGQYAKFLKNGKEGLYDYYFSVERLLGTLGLGFPIVVTERERDGYFNFRKHPNAPPFRRIPKKDYVGTIALIEGDAIKRK